jgi:hypothetical protein
VGDDLKVEAEMWKSCLVVYAACPMGHGYIQKLTFQKSPLVKNIKCFGVSLEFGANGQAECDLEKAQKPMPDLEMEHESGASVSSFCRNEESQIRECRNFSRDVYTDVFVLKLGE